MAVTVISAGATANGFTTPVTVPESRCYTVQVAAQGAAVIVEASVDGTNYFGILGTIVDNGQAPTRTTSHVDRPVQKMRLNITNYSSGSITASVISS